MTRISVTCLAGIALSVGCSNVEPIKPDPALTGLAFNWTLSLSATGKPAANTGMAFAFSQDGQVHAVSLADGSARWTRPVAGAPFEVHATDSVVIAVSDKLYGLSATSGEPRWTYAPPEGLSLIPMNIDDDLAYPVLYNGTGKMAAVDIRTGVERWRTNVLPPDSTFATGQVFQIVGAAREGSLVAVAFSWRKSSQVQHRGGVAVVDRLTGALLWSKMLPIVHAAHASFPDRPTLQNEVLVVPTEEGWIYAFDARTGTLRWRADPLIADTIIAGGSPYLDYRYVAADPSSVAVSSGGGIVRLLDLNDGHLLWERNLSEGSIEDAMQFDQDQLVVTTFSGTLFGLKKATGAFLWHLGGATVDRFYRPQVRDGTLFLAGERTFRSAKLR